jgi:aminoglycoside phosphotransferase (APT) family kinase protein
MSHPPAHNDGILLRISAELHERGVLLGGTQPKPLESQGFMSRVFTLDSNKGKLILHLSETHEEQKRQKIWEKISGLASLLDGFPDIPTAPVLCAGTEGNKHYIVQRMLPGVPAGARTLDHGLFRDVHHTWSPEIEADLEGIVARINQIPLDGYGWIVPKGSAVGGGFATWQAFLKYEFEQWIKGITFAEGDGELTKKLEHYFTQVLPDLTLERSFLVHGDITNPSNILVSENKVTGLVDWEWSLAGDPAWEFAFSNPYSLGTYFATQETSGGMQGEFRRRIDIYKRLYLVWAMHAHAKTKRFYNPIRRHLLQLEF